MNVILVSSMTVDGRIGKDKDHFAMDWNSKGDRKSFSRLTKEAGVIVMGGNTYRTIGRALPERRNIVYSRTPIDQEGIETTQEAPAELLTRLQREGHDQVAICGGQTIYDMFLRAGLVDELYLTLEPLTFGAGIPLTTVPLQLALLDATQIDESTLRLHYKVLKD